MDDSWFVIYTNETGSQRELWGPFPTEVEAEVWATARQDEGWKGEFLFIQPLNPEES